MKLLIISLVLLVLSGCATKHHVEYYESGAVKSETVEESFTLGTQGMGSYTLINLSAF
jgi:uncharacterized lipoprotein